MDDDDFPGVLAMTPEQISEWCRRFPQTVGRCLAAAFVGEDDGCDEPTVVDHSEGE